MLKRDCFREDSECPRKRLRLCTGWCEANATKLHCYLCVRYFRKRHEARPAAVEKGRQLKYFKRQRTNSMG
jgi:hypothetical protein